MGTCPWQGKHRGCGTGLGGARLGRSSGPYRDGCLHRVPLLLNLFPSADIVDEQATLRRDFRGELCKQ